MEMGIVIVVGALAALALWIGRFVFSRGDLPVTAEWIDELSPDRYRPMLRLLDAEDFNYLRAQPGFTPRLERKLRVQRYQIFRGYLRTLSTDFRRISAALRLLMLASRRDRPELAAALLRHQVNFACSLIVVYFRLGLYRLGIGSVNARKLVELLDQTRAELRDLRPAAQAAWI